MKSYNLAQLPRVALHPDTIKHIKQGHPWVTEDSYTKRFPANSFFLVGINSLNKQEIGIFINDPRHKHIKARLWNSLPLEREFANEIQMRINTSFEKRIALNLGNQRDNFLLINAENDFLPGLLVLLLKDQILIQYYALFWRSLESLILPLIKQAFATYFPEIPLKNIWIQERNFDQKKSISSVEDTSSPDFVLREYKVNYQIKINENYDYGLYTDMSAIRKQMLPYFTEAKSVLNLFCYTGAFSLFALSQGATEVVSVDLSSKYLDWLQENLELNPELNASFHHFINSPTDKALNKFKSENKKFEIIICDPPSASSDGDKISNALKSYEQLLPAMLEVLEANGKIFAFLNTHQISWNKFEEKLKQIIATTEYKDKVLTGKRFKLAEDYLPIKGFYEGDYLKGILIEFKKGKI
jgi:23S rRNA (cytosine1962-C5)-methyltransferase